MTIKRRPRTKDRTGQRFGRLLVLRMFKREDGVKMVECLCDCGTTKATRSACLTMGTTSCGCERRAKIIAFNKTGLRNRTHGMTKTEAYRRWGNMLSRCLNPNVPSYKYYGARGIAVCKEWVDSFEAYYRDMGDRPAPGMSVDRVDNDKGYSKENCRWATKREQSLNRRRSWKKNKEAA